MEGNRFECSGRLEPGKALKVIERSPGGVLISEYKGFYNPKKFVVTLYPTYNPFAQDNTKKNKRSISAMLVKVV